MVRILWINPVGTGAYDAPIGAELRREAAPGTRVDVCSLPGVGPQHLEWNALEAVVAGPTMGVVRWASEEQGYDAAVIGCFYDPFLRGARELAGAMAVTAPAVAWVLLSRTRFGRHVYAVGGNAEAARLAGVPVARVKATTFALAGAAAGLAGVVSSSRSLSALPSDDFSFVFGVIAAVVVGGTSIAGGEGAVWRTIAGAFFIALMINGFNLHQVDPIWQRVIQGAVILAAVSIDSWTQRRSR